MCLCHEFGRQHSEKCNFDNGWSDTGKTGLTDNGVGMKIELTDRVTEATLSYRFAFSRDYDWTLGGKLPGLSSISARLNPS